jgi:hypothetical protein
MLTVINYTIYHSPNAYLDVTLAERELAKLPVWVKRQPIFVPISSGLDCRTKCERSELVARM